MSKPALYSGWHQLHHAHLFERGMFSVNRLVRRKSDFYPNEWIMDSGAFTRLTTCLCGHGINIGQRHWRGQPCNKCECQKFQRKGHLPIDEYARQIERWSRCGSLVAAVSQDYMCEEIVLLDTAKTVLGHQWLTVHRYDALMAKKPSVSIMPVLQGYEPWEYVRHIAMYGDRLHRGMWVGVGSVCKRNSSPRQVEAVLRAIKRVRPDLRLHGFGLKKTALTLSSVNEMLYSCDSMSSSYGDRMDNYSGGGNNPEAALRYAVELENQPIQGVML